MTSTAPAALATDDLRYFENGDPDSVPAARFILERGEGCVVWDIDGRSYLDAHASAWLCQIGHARPEMTAVAAAQLGALEHFTTHEEFRNPRAIALARRLAELAPVENARVRFSTSGSEADDDALQLVRRFQVARGKPDKNVVLAVRGAYHGHTYGGLELAGRLPQVPGRTTIPLSMPDPFDPAGETVTDRCVSELRAVIDRIGADSIAAMFGEPVFGPAGMFAPPADYWPRMVEVLHEHDILFVADEVVTAFGRCGAWFGSSLWNVRPDVIVVAKGIASGYAALSATIISGRIAATLKGYHHGGSYAGHPVACALALTNLDIIEQEDLIGAARARGAQLVQELEALTALPAVLAVRGVGLMVSVWLDASRAIDRSVPLDRRIRDRQGVIVMGDHSRILITPPLTISAEQVTSVVTALRTAIATEYR